MAVTPTREDRFSFGLWTVGWQARDPFGDATRPALDPVESVHRLAELGAYGVSFHDDDLVPFGSHDAERDEHHQALHGRRSTRPASSCRWSRRTCSPTPCSRTARSPATTATSAASRCARSCATSTWPPSSAPRPTCSGAAARARRPTPPRTCARRSTATARASTRSRSTSIDQGYNLRFALEPKPNEPRGDILLPTIGHALGVHLRRSSTARWSASTRRSATSRWPGLNFVARHRAGAVAGQALPHRPERPARHRSTTRTSCSATATC